MNQKKFDNEILIDWQELFYAIWQKRVLIALIGLIGAFLGLVGSKLLMTPMYQSETTAYILERESVLDGELTASTIQVSSQLTNDYMELVKSRWVLSSVIEELGLDMTEKTLSGKISASCKEDTRILVISVVDKDPMLAQKTADMVCQKAAERIKDVMGIEAVNVIDEANLPSEPCSPNTKKNIVLGFLVGVVLTVGVIGLIHVLDDTVKTPDDVERYFDLSVIGSIPYSEAIADAKKSRRKTR